MSAELVYDSLVESDALTSWAIPTEYEGKLKDGRFFYFRFRSGWASLGFGESVNAAVSDSSRARIKMGGDLDGFMTVPQYHEAFVKLYNL